MELTGDTHNNFIILHFIILLFNQGTTVLLILLILVQHSPQQVVLEHERPQSHLYSYLIPYTDYKITSLVLCRYADMLSMISTHG